MPKGAAESEERLFDLTLTGQLSLDFVNTIDWRTSDSPVELVNSYADLLRWGRHAGALTDSEARSLAREAARRADEARAALERAIALRETLFRIFSSTAQGRRPDGADVKEFNGVLGETLSRLCLAPSDAGFVWEWEGGGKDLDALAWRVARAAGELLTSEDVNQLRECAGTGCGWLFVDTSRNKSRRWCTMGVCGNRAKARRFYEQVKSERG